MVKHGRIENKIMTDMLEFTYVLTSHKKNREILQPRGAQRIKNAANHFLLEGSDAVGGGGGPFRSSSSR